MTAHNPGRKAGTALMAEPNPFAWITTATQLADFVAHLREVGRFGFDTEFVSESTYEPQLGLIQIATREVLALIDPLAVGDLGPLWGVLHDPNVEVVMHAGSEDLWIIQLRSGRLPARVVDLQIAAGFVGYGYPLSLGHLVRQSLGLTLPNGDTRTDWLRRPLAESQLHYALNDVRYLLEVAERIDDELDRMGRRTWVEAEYRELLDSVALRDGPERWRRLPGLGGLNRRGLEAAHRLWLWRRELARQLNRPVRSILRDDILITIAKKMPTTPAELDQLRDVPRGWPRDRISTLLQCIREAQRVPDSDLPEHAERLDEPRGMSMIASLLSAVLNRCCAEHRIAAGLVATVADLKDLIRWERAGRPADSVPILAQGWRAQIAGDRLLDVLSGKSCLRVADLESEMPLAIEPADTPRNGTR
ncbi:MAG: ribonuclease D [Isosphaeraceae bacterium]|jgi:ribonuclease D|nr:MAG: ribonuclease D [Isosphaeraceae bacterium]